MATTFTNQATLSYTGATVQSNVAVGSVEGTLSAAKQAVAEQYGAQDTVTYIISVVNSGVNAATGLTVTDDLGAYAFGAGTVQPLTYVDGTVRYYIDGVLQPSPTVTASDTDGLVITGVSVPAGGSAMLVYSATVNEYAPLDQGASVTNTVVVSGETVCDVTAQETVDAVSAADVELLKSVTPVPVAENGTLTYTFLLRNTGNTAVTAAENAVISDTFAPVLTDISVTLNGAPLAETTGYTYDETSGVFITVQGVITVPEATYTQDPDTGAWAVTPGTAELTVTGTVGAICDLMAP